MKALTISFVLLCLTYSGTVASIGMPQIVHMTKQNFLDHAFDGKVAQWKMLRLNKELKSTAKVILGHAYAGSRIRYWHNEQRTAWIIDEIGKEYPITMGFVVENDAIVDVKILVYREERGGEVHEAFFTAQFAGITRQEEGLSRSIDGITGATLSVDAVTRVAELVLTLHEVVSH